MKKTECLRRIHESGVVAVIRCANGDKLIDVSRILLENGIPAIEVTMTVPKALQVIEKVADSLGDQIALGVGTVLDAETARSAILAGANYIISPNFNPKVIEVCQRYDKAAMPGAFTPTEVVNAWQAGADVVKIFPANFGGPSYIKALKGPLPQVEMMPTGGVNPETIVEFLKAGSCAAGAGGSLVSAKAVDSGEFDAIAKNAKKFRDAIDGYRKELIKEF